jgi:hypothetical protein
MIQDNKKRKFLITISKKEEIITKQPMYYQNLHNPNLPAFIKAEPITYSVPYLEVEISKEDNSPLEEEDINLLTDYLEKYYNNSKIVFK